jgi:hypothetical protein
VVDTLWSINKSVGVAYDLKYMGISFTEQHSEAPVPSSKQNAALKLKQKSE